jgi:hypothetical protein
MTVQSACGDSKRIVRLRCAESQRWWLGVEPERNGNRGVRLALVASRVLEPEVEPMLSRVWNAKPKFSSGAQSLLPMASAPAIQHTELPVDAN